MKLTGLRLKLLIFQIIVTPCLGAIMIPLASKSEESSELVEATVKILKTCYATRVSTIGLAGNVPGSLIASIMSQDAPVSTVLIDSTRSPVNSGTVSPMSRHKLQVFAIAASSSTELHRILVDIKNSRWWNHLATIYILLDWPASENGCSRAFEFLWTAWRMNLLEANFACNHRTKGRLIYTFNPYTSYAPKPWTVKKIYRGENGHPWTLLVRKYRPDSKICSNIEFDKTKNLGGYEIRLSVLEQGLIIRPDVDKTGVDFLAGPAGALMSSCFRTLNATVKLIKHGPKETLGFVNDKGIPDGVLAETVSGITDIGLIATNQNNMANITTTYPHYQTGLFILTQYRGHESQWSKLVSVIDLSSRIGLGIVCLVTLIFLKYAARQTTSMAVLNVLRMICNTSLADLPDNLATRIYVATLLMFMVTTQAIYQGQLASLLTKREPLENVNTLQDLAESNHKIYIRNNFARFIDHEDLAGRLIRTEDHNCTKYVLRDSSAACLNILNLVVRDAAQFNLHLSSDLIVKFYVIWVIREDWPLERRFNQVFQRFVESNLFEYSMTRNMDDAWRGIKANNDKNKDKYHAFKALTLDDMGFAFSILGIGLALATISFIVEMTIRRKKRSRIERARALYRGRLLTSRLRFVK